MKKKAASLTPCREVIWVLIWPPETATKYFAWGSIKHCFKFGRGILLVSGEGKNKQKTNEQKIQKKKTACALGSMYFLFS